jgi:acyl-CoA thioester hydrolase
MSEAAETYTIRIAVRPEDIDELGHVNNVVYLQWVQQAAMAHWQMIAPAADQAALRWVVVRHEIDYKQAAYAGDEILARTWVGSASRLKFVRDTEITRASDNHVLAAARTVWCPIDARTGRPVPVSPAVRALFSLA